MIHVNLNSQKAELILQQFDENKSCIQPKENFFI